MSVNTTAIRQWVEALRSGKYTQGCGALRPAKDKWCCLGVACDVYRREKGRGRWVREENDVRTFYVTAEDYGYSALPPPTVAHWLFGDEHQDLPTVRPGELAQLNDDELPFEDIAELIEQEWLASARNDR